MQMVYPRVYGETMSVYGDLGDTMGLSPRVRGNQARRLASIHPARSIPACTGKPLIELQKYTLQGNSGNVNNCLNC